MKKILFIVLIFGIFATNVSAREIVYSKTTEVKSLDTISAVNVVTIADDYIFVEECKRIEDDEGNVISDAKTGSFRVNASDTFINPEDGKEYSTYDYFMALAEIDFDKVESALLRYKEIQAYLAAIDAQEEPVE